jgi:low temperature requirement protein LtrA
MAATAVDHEHRVMARELFFDLVFVRLTQVATCSPRGSAAACSCCASKESV